MILVDSSVWIDYFRGLASPQASRLDALLGREVLVTGDLIVAEVLQGFTTESAFNTARQLMTTRFDVVSLVGPDNSFAPMRKPFRRPVITASCERRA